MEPANNIPTKIQSIFDKNVVSDLQRFIKKRQCLNETNMVFIYLFHIVQTAGILTTTIAAGNNAKTYMVRYWSKFIRILNKCLRTNQ